MSIPASGAKAPRSRIHVLDFIRLIAMLLMIQGHTLDAVVNPARVDWNSFGWSTWLHLRGLTAPLFLMVSGAATVLGVRRDSEGGVAHSVIRRRVFTAFKVLCIGYLLVFPANRLADLQWVSWDVWRGFLQVNILQLNGLALLALTLLLAGTRSLRRYAFSAICLGLLVLIGAPFVYAVDWHQWLPEGLAAYLSFRHGSLFPLFPAGAFMFLGVGLGALLVGTPEERRLRTFRMACLAGSAGLMLVALGLDWSGMEAALPVHDPYKAGYAYTLLRLAFALLVFGVLAWVAEVRPSWVEVCASMGRKSLFIYVVHLVFLYGTPWGEGLAGGRYHSLSVAQGIMLIPLVIAVSFGTLLAWEWVQRRSDQMGKVIRASAACALFYALIF
ncbi:heparan-alpha-glucosaminide N-acetyltransferase domain-containing protein [Holophaga foetida]|uniref:heparan-alpha-glucosaminide N-acetyltransferase domain-containing protein n=1 Tax=Holophaga foetida TaxID=35839 RepID=UPI00024721C9|nr:heparan-alpha-glucosaminide N-acetyltransferase domain-containing protein [Holophaga foetida]